MANPDPALQNGRGSRNAREAKGVIGCGSRDPEEARERGRSWSDVSEERYFSVLLVDIDPSVEEAFNSWYSEKHIPEVVRCSGLVSGRRGMLTDTLVIDRVPVDPQQSPRYVALYEAESREALDSKEIDRIRGWGPFAGKVKVRLAFKFKSIGPIWWRDPSGEARKVLAAEPVFAADA